MIVEMSIWAQDKVGLPNPPQSPPSGIHYDSNVKISKVDLPSTPWNDSTKAGVDTH